MNINEYILLDENDPLLRPEQMAKATGLSVGTLANLRSENRGPEFIRLGNGPRPVIRYLSRQPLGGNDV